MAKQNVSSFDHNEYLSFATSHAPLCAMGTILRERAIFAPIHEGVHIDQKVVDYRPSDKLILAVLGFISGSQSVFDLNHTLRVNEPLLRSFGYRRCADQSVIQDTLDASTEENVIELEAALSRLYRTHSRSYAALLQAKDTDQVITFDLDLSGQPCSKNAEGATKGYFPEARNTRGRQLARFLCPSTREIAVEGLYPGNRLSFEVCKPMILKLEAALGLDTPRKRRRICLRMDAGFGTDENINYALWRSYHLLAKVYSAKRAAKLARSVTSWEEVPSCDGHGFRQAGLVERPHRYGRKTRQVAIRTLKKTGAYSFSVLVSTDLEADLFTIVTAYDQRGGVPESAFCQDNQGLATRKRRKRRFAAQQMLMLLSQLAHNLIVWIKGWLIDALLDLKEQSKPTVLAIKTVAERGIKRMMHQILFLKGTITFNGQRVQTITLHPGYPLISRVHLALHALGRRYGIPVSLGES